MEYTTIQITGNQATARDVQPITAGTVGGKVALHFDGAWEGFQKTLVWQGSGLTVTDADCTGIIPAAVLTQPDSPLYLGVYGTKDQEVLPTVWVDLGTILPGADPTGDEAADPTLPVWAQIMQKMRIDDQSIGANAWSSKNTVDKLCPTINESGSIVACEPVAGYPLTVQADDAAKVYRSGKNLIKLRPGTHTQNGITMDVYEDGTVVINGTATATVAIDIADEVYVKEGATYTLSGCADGSYKTYQLVVATTGIIELYNPSAPGTAVAKGTGFARVRVYVYKDHPISNLVIKPQLEVGSTATEYEPYRAPDEFTPGETIPALDGVNTIWADSGDVTVSGKADPVALIGKLTNAILSLGGNV